MKKLLYCLFLLWVEHPSFAQTSFFAYRKANFSSVTDPNSHSAFLYPKKSRAANSSVFILNSTVGQRNSIITENSATSSVPDYSDNANLQGRTLFGNSNRVQAPPCPTTLTVDNLGDNPDANPGDGVCATSGGTCTLRAAIQEANALSDCSPITISFSTNGTITLGSELPEGTGGTRTINGNGTSNTIIQANANENTATYAIFSVRGSTADWTFNNLTIRHGGNDASAIDGGGLRVSSNGTLTVNNCIIEKCRGDDGGAIFCLSSTLNVTNCTIRNNSTAGAGGGIYCQNSQFTLTNSTITNNQTNTSSSNAIGGGIASLSNALTMTGTTVSNNTVTGSSNSLGGGMYLTNINSSNINITDCTFSDNSADPAGASNGRGGGIYYVSTSAGVFNITDCLFTGNSAAPAGSTGSGGGLYCSAPHPMTLTNTVFSTNTASQRGGGIHAVGLGTLTLNNVTISGNTTSSGSGGGIYQQITTINLNNTLIANNTGGDYTRSSGTLNAQYSLIEEGLSAVNGTNTANRTGDPALNPDLTLTSGSLAAGGGSNALIPNGITTDLAGNARIQQGTVDIGAYESAFVGNTFPAITAEGPLTRQRGNTGTESTIATVNDNETGAGSLTVTTTTVPSGLTVSSIVNSNGTISAIVEAGCTAAVGANTVVLTVTDGGGLTATANLTVNVTASPVPTAAAAGEDRYICLLPTVSLSANAPTVGSGSWSIISGPSTLLSQFSNVVDPTSDFTPLAYGNYTLRWTISTVCNLTSDDEVLLSFNPLPAAPTATVTVQPTCMTPTGTIVVTAPIDNDIAYSVDGTNYQPSGIFTNLAANTVYSVTAKNTTTGCVSSPLFLTINPAPTTVDIAGSFSSANPVCQGSPTGLLPNTGGTWTSNDPAKATVTADGQITTLLPGTVIFTFTTPQGCTAESPVLTIKPTPSSALAASQTEVCPNTQVTLDAHCSIPTATVQWNPGAPTVIPDAANVGYTYRARCEADGCVGNESSVEVRTHRILVDMKELTAGMLPQPILRSVQDNLEPTNTITAAANARRWTFIATGCAASESAVFKLTGPVNFSSIDNGAPYAMFANEGTSFYSLEHPNYGTGGSFPNGTYHLTVELRSADGVGGPFPKNRAAAGVLLAVRSLQFTVQSLPSVVGSRRAILSDNEDRITENGVFAQVMPNPVAGVLRLKVSNKKGEKISISLKDAAGRAVLQSDSVPDTDLHSEEFEVHHLSAGIYFMQVTTAGRQEIIKVIKVE